MRICLYTSTALPKVGGQELVVDTLARQFSALGQDVTVMAPRHRHLPIDDARLPYPVVRHPRFISTRRFVAWYRRWLQELYYWNRFDVLHCHDVYPTGYLAALCRQDLASPIVITSHGGDVREGNVRLAKPGLPARHTLALQSADALIAISNFTRDGFLRLHPGAKNIVNISNGVDLSLFAQQAVRPSGLDPAIRSDEFVLFIGRLHVRKGVDVLLEALRQLRPSAGVQLVVAGDGDERAALEAQAARAGLMGHVRFLGNTTGQAKTWLLQNCRAVAVPSRTWESFGLVVLEGYAAGRPVIASTLPGMQELIQHGRTGLLVAPESPRQLAAAVERLLRDRALARRMGEAGRVVANTHSWEAIARQHIELYQRLRRIKQRSLAA
jgi:glycogen synthase